MAEFLRQRQIITTPYANWSYQARPKATAARRCNLVTLARPNREKLSQPRRVNVGALPKATQRNWLTTLKAKQVEVTAYSQPPTPTKSVEAPGIQSPTLPLSLDTKYCAVYTPLGTLCPNKFPVSQDWEDNSEEEEGRDQDKENITSLCVWTGIQILNSKIGKIKK